MGQGDRIDFFFDTDGNFENATISNDIVADYIDFLSKRRRIESEITREYGFVIIPLRNGCDYDKIKEEKLPELSRFCGMVIYMQFMDIGKHNKPHVHVIYGEFKAVVSLDGELLAGSLPRKQFKILVGWLLFHEEEVYNAWNLAVRGERFNKIPTK